MSRSASSPSLVRRIRPVVSASSRPTGYRRRRDRTRLTTVGRPCVSRAVETTPAGLLSAWTSRGSGSTPRPSTATVLRSSTSRAGSVTVSPPTVTRPSAIRPSAARREATPAWARYLTRRTPGRVAVSALWPGAAEPARLRLVHRRVGGRQYVVHRLHAVGERGEADTYLDGGSARGGDL